MRTREGILSLVTSTLAKVSEKHFFDASDSFLNQYPSARVFPVAIGKGAYRAMSLFTEHYHGGRFQEGYTLGPKESAHPIPTERSMQATEDLIRYLRKVDEEDVVLFMISGGTSAMLCKPVPIFSLEEKQQLNRFLLRSGLTIQEMNTIRSSLSQVKNGGLLRFVRSRRVFTLIESDIPSDDMSFVGSGPTLYRKRDYASALEKVRTLARDTDYEKLSNWIPLEVFTETEKEKEKHYREKSAGEIDWLDYRDLLKCAQEVFKEAGCEIRMGKEPLNEAVEVGVRRIVEEVRSTPFTEGRRLWIWAGELGVRVRGSGQGGRASEFALRAGKEFFESGVDCTVGGIASDGRDGSTDWSGAVWNFSHWEKDRPELDTFIKNSDSYGFFAPKGLAVQLGATGLNLMDLYFVLQDR